MATMAFSRTLGLAWWATDKPATTICLAGLENIGRTDGLSQAIAEHLLLVTHRQALPRDHARVLRTRPFKPWRTSHGLVWHATRFWLTHR